MHVLASAGARCNPGELRWLAVQTTAAALDLRIAGSYTR
jgi:hypothetical protein